MTWWNFWALFQLSLGGAEFDSSSIFGRLHKGLHEADAEGKNSDADCEECGFSAGDHRPRVPLCGGTNGRSFSRECPFNYKT